MTAQRRWRPPDKEEPGQRSLKPPPGPSEKLPSQSAGKIPETGPGAQTPLFRRRDLPFFGRWQLIDPEALRHAIDWPRGNTRRVDRVEEAFIAEALHVGRSGRSWISYSRRKDWYASAARYYLPRVFGYRPVIEAVGRLEELGLVDHDRRKPSAIRQRNRPTATSHGYQSRFMASERLMALATLQPPLRWEDRAPRPLILRDASGHPAPFRETAWTRAAARNVAAIEEALASSRADLAPYTPCLSRNGDFLEVADRNGNPHSVHVAHVPICRIFNGSFDHGGRFIGPPCQSWPRGIRPFITLDGEPTEELDYGQTHARMICARAGLDIADASDLFDIPGFDRDMVKRVFYILVNATSLRSALLAAADTKPRRKGNYALAASITEAIKERWPALVPYLHTGAGFWLMRVESDIAEAVLLNLTRRGIAALPVHDSFIVEAKHAPTLEEVMVDSWSRFVPSNPVVSHKQKPSVSTPLQ